MISHLIASAVGVWIGGALVSYVAVRDEPSTLLAKLSFAAMWPFNCK